MPTPAKALVVSLVSAMTFAFAAAPSNALPLSGEQGFEMAAVQPLMATQNFSASENLNETKSLDRLLQLSEYGQSGHNFDVAAAIAQARSEIGTSRATGWSAPGECIMSVFRWIDAGGAKRNSGGDPVSNYNGAMRLTIDYAKAGDVVQYEHLGYPTSWVSGVHTVLITEVNGDGTFTIVQSNIPYGSGLVTEVKNWVPQTPAGFQDVVWRF